MAYLVAAANGDFTAAATWQSCVATGLLDSQAQNTALTTSFVSSAEFTPGAETIDAILVKVASRASTPSGTISVRLATGGVAVAGTTVTIDVADLPANWVSPANTFNGCQIGWVCFKFSAPVTLVAATSYTVQATTSVANQVNLFRDGTANNWSRLLRSTTTAAPVAGDSMMIVGERTAAGAMTALTVTMNETATTDYGGADTIIASLGIGDGGALVWGTAASTNYRLRLSGLLQNWLRGTYRQGTLATPMPGSSTAELQFDCTVDGGFGWVSDGEWSQVGSPRTAGTLVTWCQLAADEAAGQTVLSVDRATGWLSGDEITISSTTRTVGERESRVLASDANPADLTVTVGLTSAHGGVAPVVADVILLNRNNRVVSTSSSFMSYGVARDGSLSVEWTEMRYMGSNTANKFTAINFANLAGSGLTTATLRYNSFRDSEYGSTWAGDATGVLTALTLEGNTCLGGAAGSSLHTFGQATRLTVTATDEATIINGTTQAGYQCLGNTHLVASGCVWSGSGGTMFVFNPGNTRVATGLVEDCVCHSSSFAVQLAGPTTDVLFRNLTAWRLNASAVNFQNDQIIRITFEDCLFFGATTQNVLWSGGRALRFNRCTFASETGFTTTSGVVKNNASDSDLTFNDCVFSPTGPGGLIPHTQDLNATTPGRYQLTLINCTFGAATKINANLTNNAYIGSQISEQRVDGATGVHQTRFIGRGTVSLDSAIFNTAAPSEKLAPEATPVALESSRVYKAVPSGQVCTFEVFVRVDGSYTGEAPQLVLRANGAIGIPIDVVLATHSMVADTWELLTGAAPAALEDGVAEALVLVTGPAGAVYVDDWSATTA